MKNVKYIIFTLLLVISFASSVFAQSYGNEWVNYFQSYYRFSIPHTGIYRISGQELQNSGVPLGSFNARNVQLFYQGKEIPCFIKGEDFGVIEFIEFYAEKNSGWFDLEMHDSPESQANKNYSLINDTASVFFTWNNTTNNLRFSEENDNSFTGYTPASYCLSESRIDYKGSYVLGVDNITNNNDCEYIKGEGYVGPGFGLGENLNIEVATPDFVYNEVKPVLEYSLLTKSYGPHRVQLSCAGIELDTAFYGFTTIHETVEDNLAQLEPITQFEFSSVIDENSGKTSRNYISYVSIKYPRAFHVNDSIDFSFILPVSASSKTYLELSGFEYTGTPYLYDLTRGLKIKLVADGNVLKALIPANSEKISMFLTEENNRLASSQISKVEFVDYSNINNSYLVLSHPKLWNSAQEYVDFRKGHLVNIQELYNQFGYGIQKHPMAIRNFLKYAFDTWTIKPEYLFIIGKGVTPETGDGQNPGYRNNLNVYKRCLIPPMGFPGSDVLLSNRIGDTKHENAIPTGRLSAQSEDEVDLYLKKVKEFESNEPGEWMKRAIHFGGGSSTYEQNTFKNFLASYENYFEDSLFGGSVTTFLKTSSDPIEISKSDSISQLINEGVSIMTFFGHGHVSGFDQNIDEPSAYNNKGKYPLMIANSCYSGNIFLSYTRSTSELWTLIPDKGVIGYLAVVFQGFTSYLGNFTKRFYQNLSYDNYGETLGKIINNTRKEFQQVYSDKKAKSTLQEFTLHGDPAIVLNSFELPDFNIEKNDIHFSPSVINTAIDSFTVNLIIKNIARTTTETFAVELTRSFQDGSEEVYSTVLEGLMYKEQVSFKLPVNSKKGQGLNQFRVQIDGYQQVNEMNESNNTANTSYYISSTDVFPIVPYNYGISPSNSIVLKANTGDPFVKNQKSVFQLDTVHNFTSSYLVEQELVHDGGVIEWNTQQFFEDNKTYFWRVAKQEALEDDREWSSSSFTYENDIIGWQQNNFGQLIENNHPFLVANDLSQQFEFTKGSKSLRVTNIGSDYPGFNINTLYSIGYFIDGEGAVNTCDWKGAMMLAVIDSTTFIPWANDYGDFGHLQCYTKKLFIFHLDNVELAMDNLVAMVENHIPDGFYVVVYSMINGKYSAWKARHKVAFESWGATMPYTMDDKNPYILVMQKGNTNITQEWSGGSGEVINANVELKSNFTYGQINSPQIGPSLKWNSLSWKASALEENSDETAYVSIFGINNSGNEVLLKDSLLDNTMDLSLINANEYPYLRLQFFTRDENTKTPSQLDFWKVLYTPVSDAAINPHKGWEFYSDTLQEGSVGKLSVPIENIGGTAMDSLLLKYWLQDSKNEEHLLMTKRIKPLVPGELVIDSLTFKTLNLSGSNSIWVELNPENESVKGYDQKEQFHFNNLIQKSFFVEKDQSDPILDVTFDGVHIMNGDLVSAKPEILIQLTDDNSYIPLTDTALIALYLKKSGGAEERISVTNNPEIVFVEAKLPENKAQIIFNHEFTEDDTYELRVRGKDASGNESGAFDYTISFRVINESSITHIFNYPNPFSTSTRFVFELTGSVLPDELRIDILTVTGKLVKVIYLSDLGNISIGKNISDYAWDGTDMYGDQLANGVYFYRVFTKIKGEKIKHRDTGTNQFFKNGFGKMYLIR